VNGASRSVGVRLAPEVPAALRHLAEQGGCRERGGLLLGWWNGDEVAVRHLVEVPDPGATATNWTRNQAAAQKALDQERAALDDSRLGYVGDWHTHPAAIWASPADKAALRRVSRQYQEPIVLIVALPNGGLDIHTAHTGRTRTTYINIDTRSESR
jgi:proteasome lid subunit RPN8/RPN11